MSNYMYKPFDQEEHLGDPPWEKNAALEAWEKGHGHDVRLKCYPEYGCQAIERERERLEDEVRNLKAHVRSWGEFAMEQQNKYLSTRLVMERYQEALEQIASMKCPDNNMCGAHDRGECQAGQARDALHEAGMVQVTEEGHYAPAKCANCGRHMPCRRCWR